MAQNSFAAIGGKQRRNLLTFKELTTGHLLILFFLILDSIAIFIFYSLGQTNVFIIDMISSCIADFFMIILLPALILYKSLENYPEIWTTFTSKPYIYYSSKIELIPRRKQSDFDYSCHSADRFVKVIVEESNESSEQSDSAPDNENVHDRSSLMHVVQVEHHRNFESTDVFTTVDV